MKFLETRTDILKLLPKDLVIAELGVFRGEFSEQILEICSPKKLYLVDYFSGIAGSGDKDGLNITRCNMDLQFEILCNKYKTNNSVILVKDLTTGFLSDIDDEYLDVVYIDADHSYEGVKKDLYMSYPKIKKGGYILGHDYLPNSGLEKAVTELCTDFRLEVEYLTRDGCPSYYIRK